MVYMYHPQRFLLESVNPDLGFVGTILHKSSGPAREGNPLEADVCAFDEPDGTTLSSIIDRSDWLPCTLLSANIKQDPNLLSRSSCTLLRNWQLQGIFKNIIRLELYGRMHTREKLNQAHQV